MKIYRHVNLDDNILNKEYLLEIGNLYFSSLNIVFYKLNYLGLCVDDLNETSRLNSFYYQLRLTELKPRPFNRIVYDNKSVKPETINHFIDKLNLKNNLENDLHNDIIITIKRGKI